MIIYSKFSKPIQTVSCSGVDTAIFRGTLIIINQLVSQAIVNCDMILFSWKKLEQSVSAFLCENTWINSKLCFSFTVILKKYFLKQLSTPFSMLQHIFKKKFYVFFMWKQYELWTKIFQNCNLFKNFRFMQWCSNCNLQWDTGYN